MVRLYQLKKRLAMLGAELRRTKAVVQTPGGDVVRFYYFEYDGKIAPLPCTSENDLLSHAEVARIERRLGLMVPI